MFLLIPVILIVSKGESGFLFHSENVIELDVVSLPLMAGGLTDSDEAAAVMDECPDGRDDLGILPDISSRMGCVPVSHHDDGIQR